MAEYGIFNDEGCLERQFSSMKAAERAAADCRDSDDELYARAAEMCPDHADDEQPRDGCELCEIDGVEDDETDGDDEEL